MSVKKTFGKSFEGRVVVRGKEVEVWRKKKQIQSKDQTKVCDKNGMAEKSHALRGTQESKDREGIV